MFGELPNYKRWTKSAVECYDRHCICFPVQGTGGVDAHLQNVQPCPIYENYSFPCQMKRAVFYLYRKFGAPPEELRKSLKDNENK